MFFFVSLENHDVNYMIFESLVVIVLKTKRLSRTILDR